MNYSLFDQETHHVQDEEHLSEATRAKVVELLNARLAIAQTCRRRPSRPLERQGPNFIALHELFDKINEGVEDYVDDIAERAVQLGRCRKAPRGRWRSAARCRSIRRMPWTAESCRGPVHGTGDAAQPP